jgi:hypothetical protein
VDRDDLWAIDVDPTEDLAERLLAQLVRYGRVPPEGTELPEDVPGAPKPQLIGRHRLGGGRPLQSSPIPTERLDRDRGGREPRLQLCPGLRQGGRIGRSGRWGDPMHRLEDLSDIGVREPDPVEEPRDLILEAVRPIRRGGSARRPARVPDAPAVIVSVPVVPAPAVDTAHEAGQRVGAASEDPAGMSGLALGPDQLVVVEEPGVDRGREPGGPLLLVRAALVPDDPAGNRISRSRVAGQVGRRAERRPAQQNSIVVESEP